MKEYNIISRCQYSMLKLFVRHGSLSLEKVLTLNQCTFGSLLIREYVVFDSHHNGFRISDLGADFYGEFASAKIHRKNSKAPITRFANIRRGKYNVTSIRKIA